MKVFPLYFYWDGECMVPRVRRAADQAYVVGETYRLIVQEERSSNSHKHFFAAVNDAWANLQERTAEQFQTSEHLRRYALIKAGYYDSHTLVCASAAEARRVAAFMKPIDEFAIITVNAATVTRFTAKSQSLKAMGKKDFQESKDKVLDILSGMIGTTAGELQRSDAA
jgi:hypothetical protein